MMANTSKAMRDQKAAFVFSLLDEKPSITAMAIMEALRKEFSEGMGFVRIRQLKAEWVKARARKQGASPRARAEAKDDETHEGLSRLNQIRAKGRQDTNAKERIEKIEAWKKAHTDVELSREMLRDATDRHAEAVLDLCVLAGGQRILLRGRLYDFVGNNQITMIPADDVFDLEYGEEKA